MVPDTVKLLRQKNIYIYQKNKRSMEIRRVACLTWNWLLMRVDKSAGESTSGMDKFDSIIDRMNMKLGSKFLTL